MHVSRLMEAQLMWLIAIGRSSGSQRIGIGMHECFSSEPHSFRKPDAFEMLTTGPYLCQDQALQKPSYKVASIMEDSMDDDFEEPVTKHLTINCTWSTPRLGDEFERYKGERYHGEGWTRAMAIWDALKAEVCDQGSTFVQTLSVSQYNSLRLLVDFWTAQYVHPGVAAVLQRSLYTHAAGQTFDDRFSDDEEDLVPLEEYTRNLYQLFGKEFLVDEETNDLEDRRNFAARVAATQRIAFETCCKQIPEVLADRELKDELYRSHERFFDGDGFGAFRTCYHPSYNGLPVGGIIQACPWLPDKQRRGAPHFLWDIREKRTVVFQELQDTPTYVFLSHTWGRWKVNDVPYATVPGVPWPVPRNTRFDVEAMPAAFITNENLFSPARYVWFDLFCIPQDRSALAKQEIANQAAIVGGAYRVVAWLNYVTGWDGLSSAVQYMASFYLDEEIFEDEKVGDLVRSALGRTFPGKGRLWPGFSDNEDAMDPVVHEFEGSDGWFTSLWTLQELYLRPDALLCNRNWELFSSPSGIPASLDTIIALFWCTKQTLVASQCNQAMLDLHELLFVSGLEALLEAHPMSPLTLGSRRHCSERRAEAIMSVVGATAWYLNTEDPESNLVAGQYPVEFLREVRQLFGGSLFSSISQISCYPDVFRDVGDGKTRIVVAGTMFPFDARVFDSKSVVSWGQAGVVDHPSLACWEIAEDGSILMPEVGIVASTEDELDVGTNQDLLATVYIQRGNVTNCWYDDDVNLHQLMRDVYPSLMKHAICIQESERGACEGVILMEVPMAVDDEAPMHYAKIGGFRILEKDQQAFDIQTWEVGEWEVL